MQATMFYSKKGGSGKTTLSLGLALHLAAKGRKTCLVELDSIGPTFLQVFNWQGFDKKSRLDAKGDPPQTLDQLFRRGWTSPADLEPYLHVPVLYEWEGERRASNLPQYFRWVGDEETRNPKGAPSEHLRIIPMGNTIDGLTIFNNQIDNNSSKELYRERFKQLTRDLQKLGYEHLVFDNAAGVFYASFNLARAFFEAAEMKGMTTNFVAVTSPQKFDFGGLFYEWDMLISYLKKITRLLWIVNRMPNEEVSSTYSFDTISEFIGGMVGDPTLAMTQTSMPPRVLRILSSSMAVNVPELVRPRAPERELQRALAFPTQEPNVAKVWFSNIIPKSFMIGDPGVVSHFYREMNMEATPVEGALTYADSAAGFFSRIEHLES